ncbi:MAG: hypothetical protein K0Q90_4254, partial [Paenibacillaceae bacterium]|nr:hypothetical protein [Paenibacillaceae bacterium]
EGLWLETEREITILTFSAAAIIKKP